MSKLRPARYHRYDDALDLTGCDLLSLMDCPRSDLEAVIPSIVPRAAMREAQLPVDQLTLMTDEAADEIHEWPHARLGDRFRHLRVFLLDGRVLGLNWKFPPPSRPAAKRPWYRRLFR